MSNKNKPAAENRSAADKEAEKVAADKAAADRAAADKAAADKAAADKAAADKAAADKAAGNDPKTSNAADVTNANENPEFSKMEGKEATDTRVSQVGPSEQLGSTKQTPDADLAAREQQLDEREKLLDKREAKIEEKEAAATEKVTPGLAFTFEKQKYKFADSAPKKIRIAGGQKLTQKEIAANDELLLDLIGGNSALIQKL